MPEDSKYKTTPLHEAIKNAEIGKLLDPITHAIKQEYLEYLNTQDENGRTPIFLAILHGHTGLALSLLKEGADPEIKDKKEQKPIDVASIDNEKLKKALSFKTTPLHEAIKNAEIGKLLDPITHEIKQEYLEYLNTQDENGRTPIFLAILHGYRGLALSLLKKGSDLDIKDLEKQAPIELVKTFKTTQLHEAIKNGKITKVLDPSTNEIKQEYLKYLNTQDENGRTPLFLAVLHGHTRLALSLLKEGADPEIEDKKEQKPIDVASIDNEKLKKALSFKTTALHRLIENGKIAKTLNPNTYQIKPEYKGIFEKYINAQDGDGRTPLFLAVLYGYTEAALLLLKEGADPEIKDEKEQKPIDVASIDNEELKTALSFKTTPLHLHRLIENGNLLKALDPITNKIKQEYLEYLNTQDENGRTPLFLAVLHGHTELALSLLKKRADPTIKDSEGKAPINVVNTDEEELIEALLNHGADINSQDNDGKTILHSIMESKKEESEKKNLIEYLLEKGADPEIKDKKEQKPIDLASIDNEELKKVLSFKTTPLHRLIKNGNLLKLLDPRTNKIKLEYQKMLKKYRNTQDEDGRTPLFLAVLYNRTKYALSLLKEGADPTIKDSEGKAPINVVNTDNEELIKALLNHGADINSQDNDGKTILHSAAETGNENLIHTLIADQTSMELFLHSPDPTITDKNGRTARDLLNIEKYNGNQEDFERLQKALQNYEERYKSSKEIYLSQVKQEIEEKRNKQEKYNKVKKFSTYCSYASLITGVISLALSFIPTNKNVLNLEGPFRIITTAFFAISIFTCCVSFSFLTYSDGKLKELENQKDSGEIFECTPESGSISDVNVSEQTPPRIKS